jgi:hypothetical protein
MISAFLELRFAVSVEAGEQQANCPLLAGLLA